MASLQEVVSSSEETLFHPESTMSISGRRIAIATQILQDYDVDRTNRVIGDMKKHLESLTSKISLHEAKLCDW